VRRKRTVGRLPAKPKLKNYCFACGQANLEGLQLHFVYDPTKNSVSCSLRIEAKYQGATGYAHGGIIATLLDEAMAKANGMGGVRAMTARLLVSYRKAVPIMKKLILSGVRIKKHGRKLYLRSELRSAENVVLAEARGLFIEINSSMAKIFETPREKSRQKSPNGES
jgi:acyl-coenzyme A thioesterase PaaI-like protein